MKISAATQQRFLPRSKPTIGVENTKVEAPADSFMKSQEPPAKGREIPGWVVNTAGLGVVLLGAQGAAAGAAGGITGAIFGMLTGVALGSMTGALVGATAGAALGSALTSFSDNQKLKNIALAGFGLAGAIAGVAVVGLGTAIAGQAAGAAAGVVGGVSVGLGAALVGGVIATGVVSSIYSKAG